MNAVLSPVRNQPALGAIPGVWRGDELGTPVSRTVTTGWTALDAELPGGGWPYHSLTEILAPQPSVLEWRLLGGALRQVVAAGGQVVAVGPPKQPHLPGLLHLGISQRHLVWIRAEAPAERLWVTEQLIKSNATGAIVAWLTQARQEQIRRLQVCAAASESLVFLCRAEATRHEASAAPLRLHASYDLDWQLRLDIFKRRGAVQAAPLVLPSVPGGLASILTPRLKRPSRFFQRQETADVVGSPASQRQHARDLALH